ncbi:hypothetical protein GCM10022237_18710 [Nocardioides ginsengisoli]
MPGPTAGHRVKAVVVCRSGHSHEVCIVVHREVHPNLRCSPDAGPGYGPGGGGCILPPDLSELAERELRDHYQESVRRGSLLIAA